mgnify:CR=1 FL=1
MRAKTRRLGGGAVFNKESTTWTIEISSLVQLQKIVTSEGPVVLDTDSIVIYDDYLE